MICIKMFKNICRRYCKEKYKEGYILSNEVKRTLHKVKFFCQGKDKLIHCIVTIERVAFISLCLNDRTNIQTLSLNCSSLKKVRFMVRRIPLKICFSKFHYNLNQKHDLTVDSTTMRNINFVFHSP